MGKKTEEALGQFQFYQASGFSKSEVPNTESLLLAIESLEKQSLIERAVSAFIGQSGENDGYLGCYMVHKQNYQYCQTGDTVKSLDELVEWYKTNFPEEVENE